MNKIWVGIPISTDLSEIHSKLSGKIQTRPHITLAYVGDVSDAGYLSTRLATIRFPIFDVAFDDFYLRDSFFCLRVKSPYLSYLRKEITKIIPAQGKFFPHVTLAEHVEEIDEVLPLAENEQVTCFQLYNTRHGKYHLLGQYNLG